MSTSPSLCRIRRASRTGDRLTPASSASLVSVRRAPGISSPEMIRSASQSATVRESSLCSAGWGGSSSETSTSGGSISGICSVCCVLYTEPTSGAPSSEVVTVKAGRPLLILALALLAAAGAAAAFAGGKGTSNSAATPQRGGSITIARQEDSQSFDKTNVFQNESIWLAEQIMEPLYTVTADGKSEKPWLATSYTESN